MTVRDLFEMNGRVAVVTGSGQGIGRSIALGLADFGCDVVLNSRRIHDLEATAAEIEKRGRSALIVQGDIRDFSETLADQAMERFGHLDIWVTNVGGSDEKTTRRLVETSDEVFRSQLDLNLTSAFQGCKAAAPRMGEAGSIINISSGAGTRGSPFTGPYAAAKAGMNNLTQTLALELAPAIRVNAVAPGPGVTEAFREVLNVDDQVDEIPATRGPRRGRGVPRARCCIVGDRPTLVGRGGANPTGPSLSTEAGKRLLEERIAVRWVDPDLTEELLQSREGLGASDVPSQRHFLTRVRRLSSTVGVQKRVQPLSLR